MYHGMGRFGGTLTEGFWGLSHGGYGGYIAMGIGLLLLIILLVWIVKRGNLSNAEKHETPFELLQKRFINGEISQEEFISKKEILKK